jgi:hypothetical protein
VGKRISETNTLWYRRSLVIPEAWTNRSVRLHFGGVDWGARVFVDGREVARHRGGYDPFSVVLAPPATASRTLELTVAVQDATEGQQPRGKQSINPEGIFYTPSSGIWQTVWMEPVPSIRIDDLRFTPDLAEGILRMTVAANRIAGDARAEVIAFEDGHAVAKASGPVNAEFELMFEEPRPWSPDMPFLYDLQITLFIGEEKVDQVKSYFGFRNVTVQQESSEGTPRILLNGEPLFQVGVLDQGFWPDGLYTAPADQAWETELGLLKQMGFNTVRKHVKVEPERWYYWCDRLGLLVWQDMPSANNVTPAARRQFESELERMIRGLHNHPSIIMWVLFNEGWGQYDTERLVRWAKRTDPSRLVNGASGWIDRRVGDIMDIHSYPGPEAPPAEAGRASVIGEFGGLGLPVTNHLWSARSWGYEVAESPQQLASRYANLMRAVYAIKEPAGLSAVIYTQLSDVETEVNGLLTYDRRVIKIDPALARSENRGDVRETPMVMLSPPATYGRVQWRYSFRRPGPRWSMPDFNPQRWRAGRAGFGGGDQSENGQDVKTPWASEEIWMRRTFNGRDLGKGVPHLRVRHQGKAEFFLNGVPAASVNGLSDGYMTVAIAPEAAKTLRDGPNVLAIHASAEGQTRFIDAGLVLLVPEAQP